MDDARIWTFEESLWTGDPDHYANSIDVQSLFVVPTPPFILSGEQAIAAMADTPRWTSVALSEQQVVRPQEGLIVAAYKAVAQRDGSDSYEAHCTTTYRRIAHEEWQVVQHQQTPPLTAS